MCFESLPSEHGRTLATVKGKVVDCILYSPDFGPVSVAWRMGQIAITKKCYVERKMCSNISSIRIDLTGRYSQLARPRYLKPIWPGLEVSKTRALGPLKADMTRFA